MSLATGTKLGTYEIAGPLGAGGMGEVYRARDSRLKREVAIKIVSDRLARDAALASRLRIEALMLASLNHPNIAAIYGLEEFSGQQFFVMELVEGETLAEIIASRTRLPWEEALTLCSQVAAALEAAHLKRITHRDVKPSNVKVTPEGLVKVLDFGLAKTFRDTQTVETQVTTVLEQSQPGSIVGTLAYMSPEQARGKPVDHRTDIWAFGCLLYEMLTGKKAFQGETPSDTLASILGREPDWHALPPATPVRIKDLLRRCLQKDADLRFQDMGDVLVGIEKARTGGLRITRRHAIVATVMAVGVLAFAFRSNLERQWHAFMLPKHKNIVVLRFLSIGGDALQQAFSDGLTETLTTALNKHGELSVIPATESKKLENAKQARKEFGVNLVVSGQLQRRGEDVRLTLSLTDAERNRQYDAEPIDWPVARLFAIEDAALVKLADLLNLVLTEVPEAAVSRVPGAHDAYLRGRGFLYRFDRQENLDRALQDFEDAAFRDPRFALAYVGKAETYLRIYRLRKDDPQILERARLAAERALELNPGLATPHVVLGGIEADIGQYEDAIRELENARKLDPRDPAPYRELGVLYYRSKRYPEAEAIFAKAISERPGDWLTWRSAGSYYANRQKLDEAERYFRKVIELTPDNHEGYNRLGAVLLKQKGKQKEAEEVLLQAQGLNPTPIALTNLGFLYMQQRKYKNAVKVMQQAADLAPLQAPKEFRIYGNLGDAYWLTNDIGKAKQSWQQAASVVRGQITGKTGEEELWVYLAKFEAKAGDSAAALLHIDQALKSASENAALSYQAGLVYGLLGRNDLAVTQLAAAIRLKYPKDEIQQAPELKTLWEDPGYLQLFASPQAKP